MPARAPPLAAAGQPAPGSGSLPGLVLFEPGHTGIGYIGSNPLRHPDPIRNCTTAWQETVANGWAVSVWNKSLQRFRPNRCNRSIRNGRICPSLSAINSAHFLSFQNSDRNIKQYRKEKQVPSSAFRNRTSNRKWEFCNSNSEVTSNRFWRFVLKEG